MEPFPSSAFKVLILNICYYHQDPHRRPLRPGSRPGFCSDRRALLLIGAWLLPRRPGIGRALQRHPFSGLVDSAVGHRNPASGSSRIASSAYQKWPTWSSRFPGAAQQSSRANSRSSSSYPEGNFGGNQLLDGSISLSPLYQVRRTICTSVSLRASTRVSSGFAPLRHSSPSFGSRQVCSLEPFSERSRSVGVAPPRGDRASQLPCALRVYLPVDSHTCQTPWSVFQDGSNGEPAGQHRERAVAEARQMARAVRHDRGDGIPRAYRLPGLWPPPQSALVRAPSRSADRLSPFHIRPGRIAGPHPLPSRQFQALLTLFSKSFSSFPRGTCSLSVSRPYLALDGIYRPDWGCIPKQPDSPTAPRGATGSGHDGALTLSGAPFQGTWARSPLRRFSRLQFGQRSRPILKLGYSGSLAVTRGILAPFGSNVDARADDAGTTSSRVECSTTTGRDGHRRGIAFGPAARRGAREANIRAPSRSGRGATRCVTPRQTCPGLMASAQLAFKDSMYRIFATFFIDARAEISLPRVVMTFERRPLRPWRRERRQLAADASLSFPWRVPRRGFVSPHGVRVSARRRGLGFDNDPSAGSPTETLLRLLLPLNDKVQWTSRDVAGSEPPTSPRSETLHRTIQSVGATGGVYKGQGSSQRELMTRAY
ncbi:protein TAR1 [Sesamum alatum]|uniref:Protein TAR1 n=1 Tax=Sesamum alatum TaxID=300844 RepID=A0AAE1XIG4_9LAMI|nr:protein TAR1 [Sesamum alatum]